MKTRLLTLLMATTFACVALDAHAAIFLLTNGGRLEGEWLNRDTEPLVMYEITTTGGGRLTLSTAQVERVIVKSKSLLSYEAALPKVPDTVEGHWDMAERCRKAGLKPQREIHLRRVVELSPDHSDARHALGYSKVDGEWVKPDEWLAQQGYIRHKGAWRLPQEVELIAQQERQELEQQEWRKRLRRWRTSITRGRNDSADALAQLRAVDSAYAITGLTEMLNEKNEAKPLKLLYIEILGQFNSSNATAALLKRVMTDPDQEIRERSITALQKHGSEQARAMLSRSLKDKNNQIVNDAAWALGKLNDPAAIPALIEAVVTTHKTKVYPGGAPGGINAGMGSNGGGLTMGGRPKIIEHDVQNRQVLGALTSLVPEGVNFAYNKLAWKNWWALEQAVPGVNLRRGL